MSVLILSRIPPSLVPYHRILDPSLGLFLIVDESLLSPQEREALSAYYRRIIPVRGYSTGGLVELAAIELHREVGYSHLVAISEMDLLRAARLRARLDLPGQRPDSALAFRDKLLMKEIVHRAGLPVPTARRVTGALDVIEFIEEHGYPVVLKPIAGAASVNTQVISDRADLEAALGAGLSATPELSPQLEVERFVPGSQYHVNGLWVDGAPVVIWPHRYERVEYVAQRVSVLYGQHSADYLLSASNPLSARLNRFVEQVLRALPTPARTTFHAEVFHTPDDQLVLCEIASRTAGPRIHEVFQLGMGVDLASALVRLQAGLPPLAPGERPSTQPTRLAGELIVPACAGTLRAIPASSPFPWTIDYAATGVVGKRYEKARHWLDLVATFLIAGDSEEELRERIQTAAQWIERETIWADDPAV